MRLDQFLLWEGKEESSTNSSKERYEHLEAFTKLGCEFPLFDDLIHQIECFACHLLWKRGCFIGQRAPLSPFPRWKIR